MTLEECTRISDQCVKEHFKPKPKKQPEKVINPEQLKFFIGMCEENKRKFISRDPPSDYDRTIIKTTEKKKRQSKSSSSDVPQLGAQKKQSIEPLVVGTDDATTRLCYIFERSKPDGGSDCRGRRYSKSRSGSQMDV